MISRKTTVLALLATLALPLTATAMMCGDCDGKGDVNVLDALLASQEGAGMISLPTLAQQACNVDGAAGVGVVDALLIAQCAAQVVPSLSCGGATTGPWQQWEQKSPAVAPSIRAYTLMTYDAARGESVLFGGDSQRDTWTWNGAEWTQKSPLHAPTAAAADITYDSDRQRVVMVCSDGLIRGPIGVPIVPSPLETWEWDGQDWTETTPAGSPMPQVYAPTLAYDATLQRVVMVMDSDTYLYDGATWQHHTTAPSGVMSPVMWHDSIAGKTKLALTCPLMAGTPYAQVWRLDGSTWMLEADTPGMSPRSGANIRFDEAGGHAICVSGFDDVGGTGWLDDCLEFDGNDWQDTGLSSLPPGRSFAGIAYDSARDRIVVFGGYGATGYLGDTWELRR